MTGRTCSTESMPSAIRPRRSVSDCVSTTWRTTLGTTTLRPPSCFGSWLDRPLRRPPRPGQQHGRLRRGLVPLPSVRSGPDRDRGRSGAARGRCVRACLPGHAGRTWRGPRSTRTPHSTHATSTPPPRCTRSTSARRSVARPEHPSSHFGTTTSIGPRAPIDTPYAGVASLFLGALAPRRGATRLRGRRADAGLRPRDRRGTGQRGCPLCGRRRQPERSTWPAAPRGPLPTWRRELWTDRGRGRATADRHRASGVWATCVTSSHRPPEQPSTSTSAPLSRSATGLRELAQDLVSSPVVRRLTAGAWRVPQRRSSLCSALRSSPEQPAVEPALLRRHGRWHSTTTDTAAPRRWTGPTGGHILWTRDLEGNITPGPAIGAAGSIYVATNSGRSLCPRSDHRGERVDVQRRHGTRRRDRPLDHSARAPVGGHALARVWQYALRAFADRRPALVPPSSPRSRSPRPCPAPGSTSSRWAGPSLPSISHDDAATRLVTVGRHDLVRESGGRIQRHDRHHRGPPRHRRVRRGIAGRGSSGATPRRPRSRSRRRWVPTGRSSSARTTATVYALEVRRSTQMEIGAGDRVVFVILGLRVTGLLRGQLGHSPRGSGAERHPGRHRPRAPRALWAAQAVDGKGDVYFGTQGKTHLRFRTPRQPGSSTSPHRVRSTATRP